MRERKVLPRGATLPIVGRAPLPTRYGEFEIVTFDPAQSDGQEHVALVRGRVDGADGVLTRVHSECLTSEVLGSLRCDCRDQLEVSLRDLGSRDQGVLVYLRQEGRGVGLVNKVRAYALQEQGRDTVDANLELGLPDDPREYDVAAAMLTSLGVASVLLLTNNPRKMFGLRKYGIDVVGRVPLITPVTEHNRDYLRTKQLRSGHLLNID
ncbi:MAG TPA: GTP cyclohydrolase II [Myxococcota bacterium]|nr:GTP cyclohydrolase II [Myxococcota bacterium]